MDRCVLSRADVKAPWGRMLETVWLFTTKLSRLDACDNRKIVCWCRTQASSHSSQGVIDDRVNEAGVSTAAPDRSAVVCC